MTINIHLKLLPMKNLLCLFIFVLFSSQTYCQPNQFGKSVAEIDASAAIALAAEIPFLSLNLNNYKHPSNPVLPAGEKGQWDESGIERVVVIRLTAEDWRMWYACLGKNRSIGLATSKDGIHWTKYAGNPVFVPDDPWEKNFASPSSVLFVNGKFHLYYWSPGHVFVDKNTGIFPEPYRKYICLATSADGINWKRVGQLDGLNGAILGHEPPGINEDTASGGSGVDAAKVFYFPEEKIYPWQMIYTAFGLHGQWNGLAQSKDGVNWIRTKAPIANHSGLYTQATGIHHNSGQTIRCPIRIGSVWAALSFELDGRDCAPMVGTSLDNWITLGTRSFYGNQDNEGVGNHPWCMEADADWLYLYYSTKQGLGLIKIPKKSYYQANNLWDKQKIDENGAQSKIIEPDKISFSLFLSADQNGILNVLIFNPSEKKWMVFDSFPVQKDKLFNLQNLPNTQLRFKFLPEKSASVSAWLVPK
jgi:hypothetical protein